MMQEYEDLLRAFVAIPSVEGNAEAKQDIIRLTAQWLSAHAIPHTIFESETAPSLIARIDGDGRPLLLLAHLDVVPAEAGLFRLQTEGSIARGRGVIDDKGPAVLLLLLLRELTMAKLGNVPVTVAFTTDEEIGSEEGIERLIRLQAFEPPQSVIVVDGGEDACVMYKEKGNVILTLEASGKEAHGAHPWLGDNAIDKLLRTYDRLKALFHKTHPDPEHWHATINLGTLTGGVIVNQVPARATAEIDIRFLLPHTATTVMEMVRGTLEEGVRIARISASDPFQTDPHDPFLQSYADSLARALRIPIRLGAAHGATDGRFFAPMQIPIVLHRPRGGGEHTNEEWIDMQSACMMVEGLGDVIGHL